MAEKCCDNCMFRRFPHICAEGDCENQKCWEPIKAESKQKTYKDDVLEKFPWLTGEDLRVGKVCRNYLYKTGCNPIIGCEECWDEIMEEKEK